MDFTCDFAKEVDITVNNYFTPLFTSNLVKLDSTSGEFSVAMSLYNDAEMTNLMTEEKNGKHFLISSF